jgi:hypothetical protein
LQPHCVSISLKGCFTQFDRDAVIFEPGAESLFVYSHCIWQNITQDLEFQRLPESLHIEYKNDKPDYLARIFIELSILLRYP